MRPGISAVLALIALLFISQGAATRLRGQSLSARPVMFADPAPGGPAPGRELVLGATTLTAAKRIFAVELQDETVQVPRGHAGNPERLRRGAEWRLAEATLHPEYRLDLGPDRYVLYVDEHERLIGTLAERMLWPATRAELARRHPALRLQRRWHSGDVPFDEVTAPAGPCVTLIASVRVGNDRVESYGYYFTCPTRPTE